jgi:hypothetical protein
MAGLFVTHASSASRDQEGDAAIERYLSAQTSDGEGTKSLGRASSDLDGDGQPEVILLWVLMGPTYWRSTLTVFSKTAGVYEAAASLPLEGTATLSSVKDGIIVLKREVFAKNDPLCCPSLQKQVRYKWIGRKISEVTR